MYSSRVLRWQVSPVIWLDRFSIYRLQLLRQNAQWWVAPSASTILGNIIDTVLFFSIAFYKSPDAFMAEHWQQLAMTDYAWKITASGLFFLPAYGVLLRYLTNRLTTVRSDGDDSPTPAAS